MENPFANLDKETQQKIQEMQFLEQGFQQVMMQKQAFDRELTETNLSITELESSEGDVFKLVGQIIIKKNKEKLQEELKHKKELVGLRMKKLVEQEKEFTGKLEALRKEVMGKIQNEQKQEEVESGN